MPWVILAPIAIVAGAAAIIALERWRPYDRSYSTGIGGCGGRTRRTTWARHVHWIAGSRSHSFEIR